MKTIKLFTAMTPAPTIPCDPGRNEVPTYREVKPDHAPSYLEQIGVTDMDAQIQSFSQSVDLATKIARFQSGDLDALRSSAEGYYVDLSSAPKDLGQAMKISMSIQENFDSLPDEIRSEFGSVDNFRQSVFDRTFESRIASIYAKREDKKDEVKNDSEA